MNVPKELEGWFVKIYGNDGYLNIIKKYEGNDIVHINHMIFEDHLDRFVRVMGQIKDDSYLMTPEQDTICAEWLRKDLNMVVRLYRKDVNSSPNAESVRVNFKNWLPETAKAVFEKI